MKFEGLIAWQKAGALEKEVYAVSKTLKDFGFRDQIQRAVVSIKTNIAEGFELRITNQWRQFLFIAKGSCGEVRLLLYTALDQEYIDQNTFKDLNSKAIEVSKIISGLIKSLGK